MSRAATSERRGAIDAARAASLILVVVAHLAMVVLDRGPSGALRGTNLFQLYPSFEWLTLLSPMPLFFVASGWANVGSPLASRAARIRVLVTLAVVLTALWSAITVIERFATGRHGIFSDGARISTQPLWFLTAWVPLTAAGALLSRVSRRPLITVPACLLVVAAGDLARFTFDAPRWVAYPGFFFAWAIPWILGAWWRQRTERSPLHEMRTGSLTALIAAAVAAVLCARFGYHAALIDAVPGHRSNTTPPTLFTAVASLVQVGMFMMVAGRLDLAAGRRTTLLRRLSAIAPGIYVWHLTALSVMGALLNIGLWAPDRLSWQWWSTRPVWWTLIVALSIALSYASRSLLDAPRSAAAPARGRLAIGVASITVSAGLVGLYGPDTVGMATASTLLMVVGWWLITPDTQAQTEETTID